MNNNYYKLVLIFDNFNIKICCLINCIVVGYLLINLVTNEKQSQRGGEGKGSRSEIVQYKL